MTPSILFVCTGNICRSAMAEGFLRRALDRRFGPDGPLVVSCGAWGWEGSPAVGEAVAAAAEREVDIRGHVGQRLEPGLVLPAVLVVGMTAEHRDAVTAMVPHAASKTFTLKEVARLLEALPEPAAGKGFEPAGVGARVAQADTLRRSGFAGNPLDEDIVDPLGMPIDTFRAIAWEIDELCERLAGGLFGSEPVPTEAKEEEA